MDSGQTIAAVPSADEPDASLVQLVRLLARQAAAEALSSPKPKEPKEIHAVQQPGK